MMSGTFGIVMGIVCVGIVALLCLPMMVRMLRKRGDRGKAHDQD